MVWALERLRHTPVSERSVQDECILIHQLAIVDGAEAALKELESFPWHERNDEPAASWRHDTMRAELELELGSFEAGLELGDDPDRLLRSHRWIRRTHVLAAFGADASEGNDFTRTLRAAKRFLPDETGYLTFLQRLNESPGQADPAGTRFEAPQVERLAKHVRSVLDEHRPGTQGALSGGVDLWNELPLEAALTWSGWPSVMDDVEEWVLRGYEEPPPGRRSLLARVLFLAGDVERAERYARMELRTPFQGCESDYMAYRRACEILATVLVERATQGSSDAQQARAWAEKAFKLAAAEEDEEALGRNGVLLYRACKLAGDDETARDVARALRSEIERRLEWTAGTEEMLAASR